MLLYVLLKCLKSSCMLNAPWCITCNNSKLLFSYEKLKASAAKVLTMLSSALERRYQMALQDFQRWLTANVEKTISCNPDFAGDRYSLESKLGILQVILYFCLSSKL